MRKPFAGVFGDDFAGEHNNNWRTDVYRMNGVEAFGVTKNRYNWIAEKLRPATHNFRNAPKKRKLTSLTLMFL